MQEVPHKESLEAVDAVIRDERMRIMLEDGTEQRFAGRYYKHFDNGTYHCAYCDSVIAVSTDKIDTDLGWASFNALETLRERVNNQRGYAVLHLDCTHCKAHIGHRDGAIMLLNSVALTFTPVR